MRNTRRDNIFAVQELDISADDLVGSLLGIAATEPVCILDSSGVGHLDSHLLIAGIDPVNTIEIAERDPQKTLDKIEALFAGENALIFTLSYDFGRKLQGIPSRHESSPEPDAYVAVFESLIVHDYTSGVTSVAGNPKRFEQIRKKLNSRHFDIDPNIPPASALSNTSRDEYIRQIEIIKERIRDGDTYQTNLTRQIHCDLPSGLTPERIFRRLRHDHPAPFSAFIKRPRSAVVSASPERFFRIIDGRISASPIKGTRPRGRSPQEDAALRRELADSAKDRAENTMIVDLLRNDLGRVCEFGSVGVETLCDIEVHPTLFHMVSTIAGRLRPDAHFAEILKALFPCGSITGAPKISTMRIIDEIETAPRGLSMGAIGYHLPASFGLGETIDLSVAIRTMTIRNQTATFNVGGGIVIDSDPEKEWEETVVKSKALLGALGVDL